jgi:hypothetical protein
VTDAESDGYGTPEDAARGDMPARYVTIVGARVEGDTARVWMLTNDRSPFEPYEVDCVRQGGRWQWTDGYGGFSSDVPPEVLDEAPPRLALEAHGVRWRRWSTSR